VARKQNGELPRYLDKLIHRSLIQKDASLISFHLKEKKKNVKDNKDTKNKSKAQSKHNKPNKMNFSSEIL
jgi:hypothetical protein